LANRAQQGAYQIKNKRRRLPSGKTIEGRVGFDCYCFDRPSDRLRIIFISADPTPGWKVWVC